MRLRRERQRPVGIGQAENGRTALGVGQGGQLQTVRRVVKARRDTVAVIEGGGLLWFLLCRCFRRWPWRA
jgi:hypothetical protein